MTAVDFGHSEWLKTRKLRAVKAPRPGQHVAGWCPERRCVVEGVVWSLAPGRGVWLIPAGERTAVRAVDLARSA